MQFYGLFLISPLEQIIVKQETAVGFAAAYSLGFEITIVR